MARLKFYAEEWRRHRESYDKEIAGSEVRIAFDKLCRHYKLNLRLTNGRRSGGVFRGWYIEVPYKTSFGLLCHEIAHAIDHKKRRKSKHDKKLARIVDRVNNYCRKKNYWEEEINRRTEIKVKPEPTKEELREKKLEKRKQDLLRYEKRLAYFNKLYKNKIKKAKRSIMMLERNLTSSPIISDGKLQTTN